MAKNNSKITELREICESDLYSFATYINPNRIYGNIHKAVFRSLQDDTQDELILLPRDHQKSHCIAVYCLWRITRNPSITILYVSGTEKLSIAQLYSVKQMMESPRYLKLWPEMLNVDVGKREEWSKTSIKVDHPKRKIDGIRDATVAATGIGGNTTGLHCNLLILDDIVIPKNAYTEEARETVAAAYSQLASVKTADAVTKAVGTRYHPKDIYQTMIDMTQEVYSPEGEVIDAKSVYRVMCEQVVDDLGNFLWPREVRSDGLAFGFNYEILAKKKSEYVATGELQQFHAQYFNNPNAAETNRLDRNKFQYFEPKYLTSKMRQWSFKNERLNIFASMDLAFSLSKKSDFTAIVVIGVDSKGFIYVVDIDRFKTNKLEEYFQRLISLHEKWNLKKLRIEVNAAQVTVANYIKDRLRELGMTLSIEESRPNRYMGNKQERIAAVLEPRYENGTIWHFRGGYTNLLEEELILSNPKHDDIKDALASVVEIAKAPTGVSNLNIPATFEVNKRFGGIA